MFVWSRYFLIQIVFTDLLNEKRSIILSPPSLYSLIITFLLILSDFPSHRKWWKASFSSLIAWWFVCKGDKTLRAIDSKYGESNDRSDNSDFLLLRQKDPFGELFSAIYFKSSIELTFLGNLGKFQRALNQTKWPMEFMQNCTFSTGQTDRRKLAWISYSHTL